MDKDNGHPGGLSSDDGAASVSALRASIPDALEEAIALACSFHKGQKDKAGQPYILHPLRVMLKLDGEKQRIAAVLHDVVEDGGCELGLIRKRFGPEIAEAVDALSRREGEEYMTFIARCGENDIARSVKWADLGDNMNLSRLRVVTDADRKRNAKYRAASDLLTDIAIAKGRTLRAQAMETRRAETEGLRAKPDSAVGETDAPFPPPGFVQPEELK